MQFTPVSNLRRCSRLLTLLSGIRLITTTTVSSLALAGGAIHSAEPQTAVASETPGGYAINAVPFTAVRRVESLQTLSRGARRG